MNWEHFITNPWVGFIGTALGVLGIALSIFFYLRTRKYQQPAYFRSSIKWYDGAFVPHDDVKLTFRGQVIDRFMITHLAFWNAGNETIRGADFVPASPLRLYLPTDSEIFDLRITAVTTPEIGARLEADTTLPRNVEKELRIHFDYLDEGDGFSVQVIHDSKTDDDIEFKGKLPGVSRFRTNIVHDRLYGFSSPLGYRTRSITVPSPIMKWLILPIAGFGLGGIGVWSLYWAIFHEFHWYQVFGAFFLVYLVMPFVFFLELNPPKGLAHALAKEERPAI